MGPGHTPNACATFGVIVSDPLPPLPEACLVDNCMQASYGRPVVGPQSIVLSGSGLPCNARW